MPTKEWYEYCRKWLKTAIGKAYTARRNKTPTKRYLHTKYTAWYLHTKYTAIKRGLDFDLSKEEFIELVSQPCRYCHRTINDFGTGLDRMDNAVGYIRGNVVPCCRVCNAAKSDVFTYKEMLLLGDLIAKIMR